MRNDVLGMVAVIAVWSMASFAHDAKRFDVTDLKAIGCPDAIPDDLVVDSDAFTCAMGYFADKPGVLHVPIGKYLVDKEIALPGRVQVVGDGFGSEILQLARTDGYWKDRPLFSLQVNTILRDLKVDQEQPAVQAGWAPDDSYDFIIQARSGDIIIEDIMIFKATRGIEVGGRGSGVGRVLLRNIRGGPFATGILIDDAMDVIRVEGVHFWPFFADSLNVDPNLPPGSGGPVDEWTRRNGVAIVSRRNDNPFFTNIFALGFQVGFVFDAGPSGLTTQKAKLTGIDLDFVGIGIFIPAGGVHGLVVQSMTYLGENSFTSFRVPVLIEGQSVTASLENIDVDGASHSALTVPGTGCFVSASQWFVRSWNQSGANQAAFKTLGANSQVWVKDSYVKSGGAAPLCTGTLSCGVVAGQHL